MVLSMETELRRATQVELLRLYLETLGSVAPSFDDAWRQYRLHASYAWVAAAFTAGAGGLQAEDIASVGLERAATALEDLDTVAAIRNELG